MENYRIVYKTKTLVPEYNDVGMLTGHTLWQGDVDLKIPEDDTPLEGPDIDTGEPDYKALSQMHAFYQGFEN